MSRIYVNFDRLSDASTRCGNLSTATNNILSEFANIVAGIDWDILLESNISSTADNICTILNDQSTRLKNCQSFINYAYDVYRSLETYDSKKLTTFDKFKNEFSANYSWKDVIKGATYVSAGVSLVESTKVNSVKGAKDLIENAFDFVDKALIESRNYEKIGRVVGAEKATAWWAKNALGLKPVSGVSTAKSVSTRFKNNLTNKNSPYSLKAVKDNYTGANGTKKCVAAWAEVAVAGFFNLQENFEEQRNSGGSMSTSRVIAETVVETGLETVVSIGTRVVVGAAVSAVLGSAAPAVAVVAATAVATTAINAGVKAITGKSTAEWIEVASDAIVDTAERVVAKVGVATKVAVQAVSHKVQKAADTTKKAVSKAAKEVKKAVSNTVKKASATVQKAKSTAKKAVDKAVGKAKSATKAVSSKVAKASKTVAKAVNKTVSKAAKAATKTVSKVTKSTTQAVKKVTKTASKAVTNTAKAVSKVTKSTTKAVSKSVSKVTKSISSTVSKLFKKSKK